jgi:hypothetical protein
MSYLRAYYAALLASATPAPPLDYTLDPLRQLFFDDQNFSFFSHTGYWSFYVGPDWPGGARANTGTSRAAVVPSETTPTITSGIVAFAGTAEEGMDWLGAAEGGGPIYLQIKVLDGPFTADWTTFGPAIDTLTYRYSWKPTNIRSDDNPVFSDNYESAYLGQSYYSHLNDPGIIQLRGMPAGRYQFRILKPANTNDPNDNGNKATYFDGVTVYTRVP